METTIKITKKECHSTLIKFKDILIPEKIQKAVIKILQSFFGEKFDFNLEITFWS